MIKITYSLIDDANHNNILKEKSKELSNFDNCKASLWYYFEKLVDEANSELHKEGKYLV